MVSDSATSSRASIISIDPAVASHITSTTQTSSPPAKHSRTGSSPAHSKSDGRGHARNRSAPIQSRTENNRSNSIRRAKNSTEVLRQKSAKSTKQPKQLETIPDSRGGRNFTIGNVGTGGVLYLKPSAHQNASLQTSSPATTPQIVPAKFAAPSYNNENIRPSIKQQPQSKTSPAAIRTASPRRSQSKSTRRPTIEAARSHHGRSQSFSTIDEQKPSVTGGRTKTLRIVINRPDSDQQDISQDDQQNAPQLTLPTLEVPIPHYRIGNPRFSDNGTPALRNSSYTRTSATPSDASATTIQPHQKSSGPPPANARAFARLGAAENQPGRFAPGVRASDATSTFLHTPIQPGIYDDLAHVYDDPTVVRYSQNVREITAATPARIIAQISSESFMDYELVSDFFLTFRSYMPILMVLDLLLARLRWAIDRQEDDGRIIRVRTFAALRHWILNYFLDDFMADRNLRVRFCNEINNMYADVAGRTGPGTSDLKVLRDLKRCWNGRCSMYWDSADFDLDGDQDEDLIPGVLEELHSVDELDIDQLPPTLPSFRSKNLSNSSWFDAGPMTNIPVQHTRQLSAERQDSRQSEQSIQAKSCSIPKNILRGNDLTASEKGSHPVPVLLRRSNTPKDLQVQTLGHRRGATSIDSDREPTPRNDSMPSLPLPSEESVIRGAIFGPGPPFVQIISSPSKSTMPSFESNNLHVGGSTRGSSPNSAQTPGVKNIFGSLRKALGGRHGHSDMALVTVSSPMPIQQEPAHRRSPLPLNMSKSHDELRARVQPAPTKGMIRIDLLCAQVAQNYESLFPQAKLHPGLLGHGIEPRSIDRAADPLLATPDLRNDRLPSHTTAQSGSILIVNDTGIGLPAMSGGLHSRASIPSEWQEPQPHEPLGLGIAGRQQHAADARTQRSSDALGDTVETVPIVRRSPMEVMSQDQAILAQAQTTRLPLSPRTQDTSSSIESTGTMRHRASYQSSVAGHQAKTSTDATDMTVSPVSPHDDESESTMPAHGLRRRPGGDLRNVENVHDLDHQAHHESLDTTTTSNTGSLTQSLLIMNRGTQNKPQTAQPPKEKTVSMINTHSSQHLRPSFEAAVSGFSHIPDDDDGGLEATLSKLEGRYDKHSPALEQHPIDTAARRRSMPEIINRAPLESLEFAAESPDSRHMYQPDLTQDDLWEETSSRKSSIFGLPVASDAGSEDDFGSLPQLKRDTGSASYSRSLSQPSTSKIMPSPLHLQKGFVYEQSLLPKPEESQLTIVRPDTAASAQSFLLDEDENLSDLSSEISVDIINYTQDADRSMSPMMAAPGTALSGREIPSHPLTYASVVNLAPPAELQRASTIHDMHPMLKQGPQQNGINANDGKFTSRVSGGPAHIPFILACDSQVLAQQMTLIEKSALTEIDWSDLVEMRWSNTPLKVLDWAEVLAKTTVHGVDLAITRFNLVSKWVRSEIVLTQNIQERAQVITKYIHVAAHARRLHNYATMVQVTVGLTSSDCTRLHKTWEHVPAPDRSLLKNMEQLVQPTRNFHELRSEIESADFSDGCIPFIGLYVHDLTYNAQKPSRIAGPKDAEPLINFERYRTAAVIVKTLLRLIDASSRYQFEPVKGVVERCLWMAALPEGKIWGLSKGLE